MAQEKVDFQFFDYNKKKKFMQMQSQISLKRSNDMSKSKRKAMDVDVVMKLRDDLEQIKERNLKGQDFNAEQEVQSDSEDEMTGKHFSKIINDLGHGSFFGEVALFSNLRRTCTVYTISNCFFGVIDKQAFS